MLQIKIDTDNAAFEDHRGVEVARILRELADTLASDWSRLGRLGEVPLCNLNGNIVGTAELVN